MGNIIVAQVIRFILSSPKKKKPKRTGTMQPGQTDVEAANGTVANGTVPGAAVATIPAFDPDEEAKKAKKKKIMRIVGIVGVLVVACWLLEIEVGPMLKAAGKYLKSSLKDLKDGEGGGEGDGGLSSIFASVGSKVTISTTDGKKLIAIPDVPSTTTTEKMTTEKTTTLTTTDTTTTTSKPVKNTADAIPTR